MDSFPHKYTSCLWSLIWWNRVCGSWCLIIWLEITVQSSTIFASAQLLSENIEHNFSATMSLVNLQYIFNMPGKRTYVPMLILGQTLLLNTLCNHSLQKNRMILKSIVFTFCLIKSCAQRFCTASRRKSETNIRVSDLHSFLRFYKNNYIVKTKQK